LDLNSAACSDVSSEGAFGLKAGFGGDYRQFSGGFSASMYHLMTPENIWFS
jgi:hypothetical protein